MDIITIIAEFHKREFLMGFYQDFTLAIYIY